MAGPVQLVELSGLGKVGPLGKPRVREARAADLNALVNLEETCFTHDRFSRRSYARALKSPRAHLRVADAGDGTLLAAGLIFTRQDSEAARLYSIAVHPAARGLGLGKTLLHTLEETARKLGATQMRLEVSVRNKAALALYKESGYVEAGRVAGYYEDGSDALRFKKRLASNRSRQRD